MVAQWPLTPAPQLMLGTREQAGGVQPLVLRGGDVARHRRLLGVSGSGKSKLLVSLFVQLFNQGLGVGLLDPHSDLCTDILQFLLDTGYFEHPDAYRRLLYLDFSRQDRFLPMNWLAQPYPDHVVARNLVEVWKRAWSSLEGGAAPQLENILLASLLVLIANQRPLTDLQRLLTDKPFRDGLLRQVTDPEVLTFFRARFERGGKSTPASAESTLRRAFLLSFSPALRYTLGQQENTLDFRRIIDSGTSVLVNLAGLDAETQRFLGCLLTVGFEQAALSRADQPEPWRRPFHLLLDEYSLFAAQSDASLARMLDMARKYRLTLTLSQQTVGQSGPSIRAALQNAVDIVMRVGHEDAHALAPRLLEYDPLLTSVLPDPNEPHRSRARYLSAQEQQSQLARELERLPARAALARIGDTTVRFQTLTVPAARRPAAELQAVIERYAQLLLTPRGQLEQPRLQQDIAVPVQTVSNERVPDEVPDLPTHDLSADELTFLRLVVNSPQRTVSEHYQAFGASVWKGSKLRTTLEERGYLLTIETRLGQGRRVTKYLVPTALALELVPIDLPAGRGGPLHRHVQQLVVAEAQAGNLHAETEYQLADGGIVDVHVVGCALTVAVEIAISSRVERELAHVEACLAAGYVRVVCLVFSDRLRSRLVRDLPGSFTPEECGRVEILPLTRIGQLF